MRAALISLLASAAICSAQSLTQALSGNSQLSSLTAILNSFPGFTASIANQTNITILAPSNAAFTKLSPTGALATAISSNNSAAIQAVINYHVLNGTYNSSAIASTPNFIATHLTSASYTNVTTGQRVEAIKTSNGTVTLYSGLLTNSSVTQANITFAGGVIHVIDTFLAIPSNVSTTATALGLTSAAGAIQQANLGSVINYTRNITAFIPQNSAFQAVGSALTNASISTLSNILSYHIINGSVVYSTSTRFANTTVGTLQGGQVTLRTQNGSLYVNQAKIVVPNVLIANGVAHVIDGVLNPNATSATPLPSSTVPAFSGATSGTAVPFTSGVAKPTTTIAIPSAATAAAASGAAGSATAASASMSRPASSGSAARATAMAAVGAGALFAGAWMGM